MSERISSFRELRVYKKAFDLQQEIFRITKSFPKGETYSLIDQFRRASRAVGANVAEAWQKRRYPAHFVSKLSDADGEQAETQHWIASAFACGYISQTEHERLLADYMELGRMIGSMLSMPEKFCGNEARRTDDRRKTDGKKYQPACNA